MKTILHIVTAILLFVIGYALHGIVNNKICNVDESTTTIKNYYDTTIHTINNYTITKGKIIRDSIPYIIDTSRVLQDYLDKHPYLTTLSDTNINIEINDTISRNAIVGRNIKYKWLQPTKIITNTIIAPKRKSFYAGGIVSYDTKFGFSPALIYADKKRNAYQISYDLLNKRYGLGYFYKLAK